MSNIRNQTTAQTQYADGRNLDIRRRLHDLYSINPQPFPAWCWEQYSFVTHCRILELGCGTGAFWTDHAAQLPTNATLVLSDISEGMVQEAAANTAQHAHVSTQVIDIQHIPFPDDSFDVLMAHHMLYHVPDLPQAVDEMHRVLRPGGILYSTTNGNNGMSGWLHNALQAFDPTLDAFGERYAFALENGHEILARRFADVCMTEQPNGLRITHTQDLMDWLASTISMSGLAHVDWDKLYDYFEALRQTTGATNIPKRVGMFVATK